MKFLKYKKIIIVCVSIIIFIVGYFTGTFSKYYLKTESVKKMIVINDRLAINNELYLPLESYGFCEQLGELFALTDLRQQVYTIKGQNPKNYLCLVNDGQELIYQSQKINPLTIYNFNPTKISISDYRTLDDSKIDIADIDLVKQVASYINGDNIAETPSIVLIIKRLLFTSISFPGIALEYQYEHDVYGDCYITNLAACTTWKIGHEIMSQIQ